MNETSSSPGLTGRAAVISGGAQGIGRAICRTVPAGGRFGVDLGL